MDDLSPTSPRLSPSTAMLRAGLAMSDLDMSEMYVGYLIVGGTLTADEVSEALRGQRTVSAIDHDYLAQALNDCFTEHGQDHPVPYDEDLNGTEQLPRGGAHRRRSAD